MCCFFCFFFKQKTAYEMRISDWSSDVCSSDLEDQYYYNTAFQIDATGESDGTSYLADESRYSHVLTLNGNAAIASQRFVFDGTGDYVLQHTSTRALWTPGWFTSWAVYQLAFTTNTTSMIRSEEHTPELHSQMHNTEAVFLLHKNKKISFVY